MDDDTGTKRLVSNVFKTLEEDYDCDIEKLRIKIKDVVVKSFIMNIPFMRNQFHIHFGGKTQYTSNKNCFQLFGIDILLDDEFNPWVLEINSNPSFNIHIEKLEKDEGANYKLRHEVSEIDKYIKAMVIADAFKIL